MEKNDKSANKYGIAYGEAVGTVAAQSLGEPTTQMVLGSLHQAGIKTIVTTTGLPRMMEIADARKKPKSPMMIIHFDPKISKDYEKIRAIRYKLEEVRLSQLIEGYEEDFRTGSMVIKLDKAKLAVYEITPKRIMNALELKGTVETALVDNATIKVKAKRAKSESQAAASESKIKHYRITFISVLSTVVSGIPGIIKAVIDMYEDNAFYIKTAGSNMEEAMKIEGVDKWNIRSNDPFEVMKVYGIEAARNTIANEMYEAITTNGANVNFRHMSLLADTMTYAGHISSVGRHGVAGEKKSVFARAAFEETVKHFVNASVFGEHDLLTGVSENILIGKQIGVGTGRVRLSVKKDDLQKLKRAAEKAEKK